MKKINRQIETNYTISSNNETYSEVIFETISGELYKGYRDINESPRNIRKRFLTFLESFDNNFTQDFEKIEKISFAYSNNVELDFNSKGERI